MAQRRAALNTPRQDEKCRHPQCAAMVPARAMKLLCEAHEEERMARCMAAIKSGADAGVVETLLREYGL
jgi:hypothetical protein